MIRFLIFVAWCLVLVLFGAYHFGPGQEHLALDDAGQLIRPAKAMRADGNFDEAAVRLTSALERLPEDEVQTQFAVRLERNKAWMESGKLPEAHNDLVTLLDTMQETDGTDAKIINETKAALANAKYYITWLMRLEGVSRDEWMPEIEASRQTFRMLAAQAEESGDEASAKKCREDLESSIRLARLDLKDLQGLPLPNQ